MLKVITRGENIEVTEAIRSYVEKRLGKLNRYLGDDVEATAHVNVKVYPEKTSKVEVTIPMSFLTLRAEESQTDMYAAIDFVSEKLERQIRKHKTKVNRKSREKGYKGLEFVTDEAVDNEVETEDNIEVVRTKHVSLKPMDSEEAILQMEMLGHNFFVYEDEDQSVHVVYRRKDGRYGLIEATN
ncbi:ribosomal subunit interface protein [Weissella beninensis]|uniref:Ribosome hibernation promoting factor n=1 Tax=Periweissella beninensis TaxID=504936 RepID=A0ABT0VJ20_9LACO|nr:ribosome-associated translation inhibitor RaiA [Periweissella beninensis]MBM7544412.1 ribosomal subunit interface protein [Periweissella beninensis]MCM2437822.1 ribosome-associated translation inhibitor RaiA [Periweissella beninensis]